MYTEKTRRSSALLRHQSTAPRLWLAATSAGLPTTFWPDTPSFRLSPPPLTFTLTLRRWQLRPIVAAPAVGYPLHCAGVQRARIGYRVLPNYYTLWHTQK